MSSDFNNQCESVKALAVQLERSVEFREKVKASASLLRSMETLSSAVDRFIRSSLGLQSTLCYSGNGLEDCKNCGKYPDGHDGFGRCAS